MKRTTTKPKRATKAATQTRATLPRTKTQPKAVAESGELGDSEEAAQQPLTSRERNIVLDAANAAIELKARRSARKSLTLFKKFTHPNYHITWFNKLIDGYYEQFLWNRLDVDGIMVFMPPRHGKSETQSVRMPAYDFGEHPDEHYIGTAYGDELANTFSKACRNIIETPQYQRLFPHRLKSRGDTKWELARKNDDQRASYISSGILSALTGEGATRLLIDDPVKNAEDAYSKKIRDKIDENYRTAAGTRLAPNGKKFLAMTRWHDDDLAGRLLKLAVKDKRADQWLVIVLAATNDGGKSSYVWNTKTGEKTFFPPYEALWPEMFSRQWLEKEQVNIGPVFWNAMYMQNPQPPSGGIFKRENWGFFDSKPACDLLVQIYDTALEEKKEADYSASLTMGATGNMQFPIYDAWRDKVTFADLVAKVYQRWQMARDVYNRYPDRVCIENKGSGISLRQQIETNNLAGSWTFPDGTTKRVPHIPVTPMPATASKVVRAQGVSGYQQSKGVLLPRGAEWVADFIDELALFDKGPHDDYVDCMVHGLIYYTRPIQDVEELAVHSEAVSINNEIDEYEMHQQMTGRAW